MAKRRKPLPAHGRKAVDDTMLIRSAETLGRMIGSLHRQLDGVTKRASGSVDDAAEPKSKRAPASARNNSTAPRRSVGHGGSKSVRAKKKK